MIQRLLLPLAFVVLATGCQRHQSGSGTNEQRSSEASRLEVVDAGCPHMENGECQHAPASPDATPSPSGVQHFGSALGDSPQVALATILGSPDEYHDKRVRVSGHVTRACSRKGCWLELATDNSPDAERCRVTFQDYSFFVPRDSAGSTARLEGLVQVTRVEPKAVQHYESEGAVFPQKSADGSAREVRLVATGVELERI